MRKLRVPDNDPVPGDVGAALEAMSAEELREVVREMLLELDARSRGRVVNSLVNRAVRGGSGWVPAALSSGEVSEILSLAEVAKRMGQADPSQVDEHSLDPSPTTAQWVTRLRDEHRRYPALRAELDRQVDNEVKCVSR